MLDELQVALEGQRRVLADRVERGQEDAERQVVRGVEAGHRRVVLSVRHGLTRILPCVTRCAEGLECGRGGREVDRRGDEEVRPGYAGAEAVQGGGELGGVVPEGEAEFDLLGHGHEGLDGVGVHAHAHHHDAAVRRRVGNERLQHAGKADRLEDHGVLDVAPHDGRHDPFGDRPRYAQVGPAFVR